MCDCICYIPCYFTICIFRLCKYCYNSKNYIAECIAEIVSNNQLSTYGMDTSRNILGQNWSYIDSTQKKVLENICQRKIYEAFQQIENTKRINISTQFINNNMNLSISYIAAQINYNLKLNTLYFNFNTKIVSNEKNKIYETESISFHKYTDLVNLEKQGFTNEYKLAHIPTEDGFKYKNINKFYEGFLKLKHKDTDTYKIYNKITTNESDYNKLNTRYFNLLKIIYENNTDYEKIILDSFEKMNQDILINNKDNIINSEYE